MGRIKVLPGSVADQIAAGEVIERPASVVKELVENALDAGATDIVVELEDGGRTLVRVSDDGSGMDRDDASLSLDRHATSKITSTAELVGVASYGFRGEALPAIASVSLFEMETATSDGSKDSEGTRVVVKGGQVEAVETTARSRGTTISVKRLFYNTPARRKFLRSQRAETRACVQSVTVLALARLDVNFKLLSDERVLIDAPRVSGIADRVASLFSRKVAEQLVPVDYATGPISVRGFVQRPAEARASGRKAYLFVNGRPFKDPFLIKAAENGYRATIPAGVRPTLFLSLGVSGDRVDVNVHPAKLEVRFRDRFLVEKAVEEGVRQALRPSHAAAVVVDRDGEAARAEWSVNSSTAGPGAFEQGYPRRSADLPGLDLFGETTSRLPGARFLQVFSTYIVFESPEGVTIVDQHAAHERVLYERTMHELEQGTSGSQRLLLPLTIDLEQTELDAVEHHKELLSAVGFEVEEFGGRSVVVHAVPNPHPRFDARRCFEELVADLGHGRLAGLNRLERFAATYACKAAVKAGQELEQEEMHTLLNRLFVCELPPHDVHGRPTMVQLPKDELERRFGRS
ncbi:MAG: DNA mismatch repair endonuclease MutL [Gemmatimonadota bacterium]|nr:MAG: DNA mismatch repair endonuclease MutL [Gemmatimonadota bacterium]